MLHLLCPHHTIDICTELGEDYFKKNALKGLIIDLDNTIIAWDKAEVPFLHQLWLQKLQEAGILVCLLSNNRGNRVVRIAAVLKVPFVSKAWKPTRWGFQRAISLLQLLPSQIAVMGDQLYTDILGGNLSGCHTVWVSPLSRQEFVGTKLTRHIEKLTLRLLRYKNLLL